jgi:HEAT repeat protein
MLCHCADLSSFLGCISLLFSPQAVLGIGIAYASNPQTRILELLVDRLENDSSFKVAAHAALALGIVFTGTCNATACQAIMEKLSDSEEADLDKPTSSLLCIGLGLLFMSRSEKAAAILQMVIFFLFLPHVLFSLPHLLTHSHTHPLTHPLTLLCHLFSAGVHHRGAQNLQVCKHCHQGMRIRQQR